MFKPTSMILAAAMVLTPFAAAQSGKEVTLRMDYDPALLASDDGADSLVKSLKREARKLCSQRIPATGGTYLDQDCVSNLMTAAIQQIHNDQTAAGTQIAPGFEKLVTVEYALAN
ncbi:MAG: UrcA family protein [Hyphomonas sp.]